MSFTSTVKVLVVDDFEPFRRFVRSTLGKNETFQIVGEAADGVDAVCQAEELQPDLILLDIGLPALNESRLRDKFENSRQNRR